MAVTAKLVSRDLGWKEILRRVHQIRDSDVHVGVLSDDKHGDDDITMAELAAVHEYGTEDGHIPARPFLRPTFEAERQNLTDMGGKLITAVLDGKMEVEQALGIVGASLASAVKKRITSNVPPPNAPSTVAAKGSDKTLIDTGRLLNSITWSVEVKK